MGVTAGQPLDERGDAAVGCRAVEDDVRAGARPALADGERLELRRVTDDQKRRRLA
jgi:hypothetical protein